MGKLLKVDLRGSCFAGEDGAEFIEVSNEPIPCSVVYTCVSDGFADVTLTMEKAVLSDAHRPQEMTLQWKKLCGATVYRHLQVLIKSDSFKNKTEAVSDGVVLPGYMRPCKNTSKAKSKKIVALPASSPEECETTGPQFEVPAKDMRTSIELRIDKDGSFEPPALQ